MGQSFGVVGEVARYLGQKLVGLLMVVGMLIGIFTLFGVSMWVGEVYLCPALSMRSCQTYGPDIGLLALCIILGSVFLVLHLCDDFKVWRTKQQICE